MSIPDDPSWWSLSLELLSDLLGSAYVTGMHGVTTIVLAGTTKGPGMPDAVNEGHTHSTRIVIEIWCWHVRGAVCLRHGNGHLWVLLSLRFR